jgi:predicted RNA-binding protein with PUA-like domain
MARKRYWLMKCEPEAYSIDDLERDGRASWEGVRNFQARNLLRDEIRVGDGVLFYASNAEPSGVSGVAEVVRAGYPDPFAFQRGHKYHDPKSDPANPTWYAVDIGFVERFPALVPLAALKAAPGLADMVVVQKGSRLSVQPVRDREFEIVRRLGHEGEAAAGKGTAKGTPKGAPRGTRKAAPKATAKGAAKGKGKTRGKRGKGKSPAGGA